MYRNMMTSLPRMLFSLSIFMILFGLASPGDSNKTTTFSRTDTFSQKLTQLKSQQNFGKCFGFKSLKHGIYAKFSVNGNLVKGSYIIDYDYSGNKCIEYPFDGMIKEDMIDIKFKQKNPYEMSLGWELEGGEKNLKVRLKIIDDRLVHSRAFSSYSELPRSKLRGIKFSKKLSSPLMGED